MVLAIDVHYKDINSKAVGILSNWNDQEPIEVFIKTLPNTVDYIPGQFYKRELPFIMEILKEINYQTLEAILIDGYVYIDNDKNFGLGGYLWESMDKKVPVIGVAKKKFLGNSDTVVEILRGKSKKPLFVSSIGIDTKQAAQKIKNMKGEYRMPTILKLVDTITKQKD